MLVSSVTPVILAGGKGERLWPLSRKQYPKQVLPLLTDKSLLQETVARVDDRALFTSPLVICDEDSRFVIRDQLEGQELINIIIEPVGRNTAAASAIAALYLLEDDADALMLLLPSDHHIRDKQAFHTIIREAVEIARSGKLVTFGIIPDRPETGYGYIRQGEAYGNGAACFIVDSFKEKPGSSLAEEYLQSGEYFWNSGIFLMPVKLYLQELERFSPEILTHARAAMLAAEEDLGFIRLNKEEFAACTSISLDYAVMEKTEHAVVMPVSMGWNDLGAWDALLAVEEKDSSGNACIGDVVAVNCHHSYLRSEGKLVALGGLQVVAASFPCLPV
jgi:mannose-1-phosphate guanylyltransferase/mannose-6-phosphate isomerase